MDPVSFTALVALFSALVSSEKRRMKVPKSRRLYHGTSLPRWKEMVELGHTRGLIYLSSERDHVLYYMQEAVDSDVTLEEDDIPGVIVEFDSRLLSEHGELMPDWDDLWQAFHREEISCAPTEMSWRDSLAWGHTCSYQGPLMSAVTNVEVLD